MNRELILSEIDPAIRTQLGGLVILSHCSSSNEELLVRGREGAATGSVLICRQQRAGRGRRGREWVSPPEGGLYFSLLWHFDIPLQQLGGLGLVVGIALAESVHTLGGDATWLKWPNDLYLDNRKLGGILVETEQSNGGVRAVIGIGLNLYHATPALDLIDQPWGTLADCIDPVPDQNRMVATLINRLWPLLERLQRQGFRSLASRWEQYDRLQGKVVELHRDQRVMTGVARGIDDNGALLLEREGGETEACYSGDLSLRWRE